MNMQFVSGKKICMKVNGNLLTSTPLPLIDSLIQWSISHIINFKHSISTIKIAGSDPKPIKPPAALPLISMDEIQRNYAHVKIKHLLNWLAGGHI